MEIPEQQEEIEVLKSIFDEGILIIQNGDVPRGTVQIHPMLPEPFFVVSRTTPGLDKHGDRKDSINYLPPMTLYFKFVKSYPATSCPAFLLTCQWLTFEQLRKLCQQLDFIWKEFKPEVVLYRWIRFLQEEALQFLGIVETLDISSSSTTPSWPIEIQFSPPQKRKDLSVRPKIPRQSLVGADIVANLNPRKSARRPTTYSCYKASRVQSKSSLEHVGDAANIKSKNCDNTIGHGYKEVALYFPDTENTHQDPNCDSRAAIAPTNGIDLHSFIIQFNDSRRQMEMDKEWFTCHVCFIDKQGCDGMRFHGCNHIYCRDCLQGYFTVQIQNGSVNSLNCLTEKCHSQALPHQVRELVGKDLFARYDKILLDSTLSQMRDITICPLKSCQCSLIIDEDSKLASCPACLYTFCVLCRMTYHGIVPCRLYDDEIEFVVEKYLNADDEEKREIEKKYGKKEIRFLYNERLSREWVVANSKKCPSCFASIQKIDGCNKMACTKCDSYFCWLCRTKLSKDSPYKHFDDPAFPSCLNKIYA